MALKALADVLSRTVDEGECAARIGGDEFSAIISIKDSNSAEQFKERLQEEIDRYNANCEDFKLGASVGICEVLEGKRDKND